MNNNRNYQFISAKWEFCDWFSEINKVLWTLHKSWCVQRERKIIMERKTIGEREKFTFLQILSFLLLLAVNGVLCMFCYVFSSLYLIQIIQDIQFKHIINAVNIQTHILHFIKYMLFNWLSRVMRYVYEFVICSVIGYIFGLGTCEWTQ